MTRFGIDFDDTFTATPELWSRFINQAMEEGHSFVMVTARRDTFENTQLINQWLDRHQCQMPVYFTSLGSKIGYMEKRGIKIDVWIDDNPEALVRGH